MKVYFATPPLAQQTGGLQAALENMRVALAAAGQPVTEGLPSPGEEAGAVVHFHGLWQPAHARAAADLRSRGVPYVVSPHGMLEPWAWRHKWWKKWPYFYAIERRYLQRAAGLVATAESEAAVLRARVPGKPVAVLPLGLTGDARPAYDTARAALGWGAQERVFLFLSRVHEKKGLEKLLHGLSELRPAHAHDAPWRVVVVGDGEPSYVAQLRELSARLTQPGLQIAWVGAVWGDARWPYFQGADLFCLPTHSENFGLAVLEAMQVGTPVLTTVGTPWSSVLHEPEGYICEPTQASVTAALAKFLKSPAWHEATRQRLAEWTADRFAWSALAPRYVNYYAQAK